MIYMIIISDVKLRCRFLFSCIFLVCATIDQNTRDSRTPTMRAQPLQIVFRSHDGFQNGEAMLRCQVITFYSYVFDLFTNCTSQNISKVKYLFSRAVDERKEETTLFWEIRSKWLSWRGTIGSSDKIAHELQVSVSIQSTKKSSYCSTFQSFFGIDINMESASDSFS